MTYSFKELTDKSDKDTSEMIHITGHSKSFDGYKFDENTFFLTFKKNCGVKIINPRYITLSGHTKGTSTSMSFFDGKVKTKMQDWDLHIQDSSYNWSKVKILNGEAVFPEYRTPTIEVKEKIREYNNKIKELERLKQKYLEEVYMELPLMKVSELPKPFFIWNSTKNSEAMKKILEHYNIKEVSE